MELNILYLIQNIRNPILDNIMIFFTSIGNGGLIWIVIGVVFMIKPKYRKCGVLIIVSLVVSAIFGNLFLKNIVARLRPCWIDHTVTLLINNPTDYSFPSGHTFSSFAAATIIYLHDKKYGLISIIVAALIGISRLYLFVHYPSDVICGMAMGIVTAIICYKVFYGKFYKKGGILV